MKNTEAIENLKAILEECTTSEDAVSYVNSEDAGTLKAAIEALEKQERERWIPVTERMPEIKHHIDDEHFSDDVLVTEWFNGFKKTRIGNFDTRTGWWNDEKGCGFLGVITSWRPLPEPYTEEES